MPDSTSTSFIPKRNPAQKEKRIGRRKVYIGTFIVRILFFAALVGAAGVYAYEKKLDSTLKDEIFSLNNAISTFDEAEMDRILGFDKRLSHMNYRLEHSASVVKLLEAIESSTVGSVQLESFNLERVDDTSFSIDSSIVTNSFDSALFQRQVLEDDNTLSISNISELTLQNVPPPGAFVGETDLKDQKVRVTFKADLGIDIDKLLSASTVQLSPVIAPSPAPADLIDNNPPGETVIDEILSEEPNQEVL